MKRILGTAEDYRRLYGDGGGASPSGHEGVDGEGREHVEIIRRLEEGHAGKEKTGDQEEASFLTCAS